MSSSEPRFLVDVGVGKGIERYLREEGYDTKAVRDIDPRMEDEEIIRIAVMENRMVITMDNDFGELVYHSSTEHRCSASEARRCHRHREITSRKTHYEELFGSDKKLFLRISE